MKRKDPVQPGAAKKEKIPTIKMEKDIASCEDMEEFKLLMQEDAAMNRAWAAYVKEHVTPLRDDLDLTDKKLAEGCGIKSLTTVGGFKRVIPSQREYVIMIAMMLKMSVAQTDDLLVKGAKLHKLYSRNPKEAIWIYLLEKGGSDVPAALFDAYWDVYLEESERCKGNVPQRYAKGTVAVFNEIKSDARKAKAASIVKASSDAVYREMVHRHIQEYGNGYWRLEEFIDRKFEAFRTSPNQMWENHTKFKSAYYDRMQALREDRKLPERMFLVALGIHLELDKEDINKMLELAGMAPLYAKDRLEGAVIFLLEELECKMPSVFSRNGDKEKYKEKYNNLIDELDENGQPLVKDDEPLSVYFARKLTLMGLEDLEQDKDGKDAQKKKKTRFEAFLRLL